MLPPYRVVLYRLYYYIEDKSPKLILALYNLSRGYIYIIITVISKIKLKLK